MRYLLRAGLALGVLAAACKDSIGPKSLADPQATTAQLAQLDTLFDIEALNSFSALSPNIAPTAPARARALALVTATNPLSKHSALRPYLGEVERGRALARVVPSMSVGSAEAIFPPEIVGKTFEWDTAAAQYDTTARAGAPATGVRFILYAVDPLAQVPVEPLVEVGYVDLIDESSGSTAKVHVIVAGVGGTPVYVNYTVTLGATSASSARITTGGYITGGTSSPDTLRFGGTIDIAASQTTATITQNVTFDVNSHDIHIRHWERLTLTEATFSFRVSYRFEHAGEVVTLDGTLTFDDTTGVAEGTITVRVDGGLFATCTFTATATTYNQACEGGDADGLSADEFEALDALGNEMEKVSQILQGLFGPPLGLLGGA